MNDDDAAIDDAAIKELMLFRSPLVWTAGDQRPAVTYGDFLARCSICGEARTQFRVGEQTAFHARCLAAEWRKRLPAGRI
jgi:hypothetical protein